MAKNNVKENNYIADDIIAIATRSYDYDDVDGSKRHSLLDDRRYWRQKALLKPAEDHKEWEKKRNEYENPRYVDEMDSKSYNNALDRLHDMDLSSGYRRRYEDPDKLSMTLGMKSSELTHSSSFLEKDSDKKTLLATNCDRQHEKYESCFAGCASVTCDNPRDRMQPCYPFCEAGCVCVQPYVRDDRTHKCVLPEECTKGLKGIPDLGEDAR
ncbi:Uncharacterized protein OBRU01_18272 [Operophtera brumata]|uniref:TIL domain-containing protein n=1 Tax=Operophtera brumata TaxID=104452 RepID=A0A0L7KZA9_OPEBR|nr:Uncharacterized protein OBRU01_18272 [Operophtera brumata]